MHRRRAVKISETSFSAEVHKSVKIVNKIMLTNEINATNEGGVQLKLCTTLSPLSRAITYPSLIVCCYLVYSKLSYGRMVVCLVRATPHVSGRRQSYPSRYTHIP